MKSQLSNLKWKPVAGVGILHRFTEKKVTKTRKYLQNFRISGVVFDKKKFGAGSKNIKVYSYEVRFGLCCIFSILLLILLSEVFDIINLVANLI